MIRHGKTENNKLGKKPMTLKCNVFLASMNSSLVTFVFILLTYIGLFTGWDDVPLAVEGVEEAKAAGRLLKLHGFEFDVVYTSWLSRAIETAWLVMDSMDCLWLPIIKSWRKYHT